MLEIIFQEDGLEIGTFDIYLLNVVVGYVYEGMKILSIEPKASGSCGSDAIVSLEFVD